MSRALFLDAAETIRLRDFHLCWQCFKMFSATPALKRVFCSTKCSAEYNSHANTGQRNPNWRGGFHVDPREGRNRVYTEPNQPSVYGYRLIAERIVGRPLTDDEVVHHVNGDPTDNRIENLEVMTQARHAQIEMRKRYAAPGCGVRLSKGGRYHARIKVSRIEIHLGAFHTREEAISAVQSARERLWR